MGRRSPGLVRILPLVMLALFVAAWGSGFYWDRFSDEVTGLSDIAWGMSFTAFAVIGAFLARKLPRNAIGWLLLSGATLAGLGISLLEYSEGVNDPGVGDIGNSVFGFGLILLGSALLLFPDGRYPRRWFMWLQVGLVAVLIVVNSESVDGLALAALLVLTLVSLIWRFVEGDATTRRQMAPPVLVGLMGLAVLTLMEWFFPTIESDWPGVLAFMLITVGIPVAIAVSVTKYRLYDIDRLVSRTLSYALVVTLLAGAVAALSAMVGAQFDNPLVVAATTLGVAAVFNPLRRRVQLVVDRRFNRSRYDIARVMDDFAGSLRDQADAEAVVSGWVSTVSETMHPSTMGVWIRG